MSSVAGSASSSLHPLVTQTLVDTKKFFCPFLERGYCREASRCNFSHDNCGSTKIPTDYCHFYLANQCLYGQDCKFRHSEPISTLSIASSSSSSLSTSDPSIILRSKNINNNNNNDTSEEPATSFCALAISSTSSPTPSASKPIASYSSHFTREPCNNVKKETPLCPYSCTTGECPFPPGQCSYLHGLDCDLCGRPCLHPYDSNQQRQHRDECLREHEREMELSFAVQRSKDKVCGICMDTVVEKKPITSSRFGILEKCNHIFCLDCIRKWRGTKHFETRTIRACPECRVCSDFVVPSKYWVEDQEDKEKLIHDYKAALRSKPCKYFDQGKGDCPFAGSCFYKHEYPDGRIAKMDTPKPRRRLYGARGPTSTVANYFLWNILTSTDDDDWSNDELESLYVDPDFATSDEEDLQDELNDAMREEVPVDDDDLYEGTFYL